MNLDTHVNDDIIWRFKRLAESENKTVCSGNCTRKFMPGLILSFQDEKGHLLAIKKGTKAYTLDYTLALPYSLNRWAKPN